ncbi:uncharacterized protein LOC125670169 [Ostrea edulis]|uniref:uncharacterized protein LOC125670169 n=1 Tax=Ostrea edulis TaxID=37623 RepID=UPI0024AFBF7D|nr:uncharacterized protein LOC125670169 [Ostrea edulis]
MMTWLVEILTIAAIVSVTLGCTPLPRVDQSDFCYAKYAFEAEVTDVKQADKDSAYEYTINIKTEYKKDKAAGIYHTVFGDGPMHSCGPQILNNGTSYMIYAGDNYNEIEGGLRIDGYKPMDNVNDVDIERMTTKYDCNCTIKFDYDAYFGYDASGLPPPTNNECNAPVYACSRSSYCKRNAEGVCTWGNHGECY